MSVESTVSPLTLVLHLRASRRKARDAAVAEVVGALRGLAAEARLGGPLSERPGTAWVDVAAEHVAAVPARLARLGYTRAVDAVLPLEEAGDHAVDRVRWRRRNFGLVRVYEEPDELLRPYAPDRRSFLLECGDGVVRRVDGYRGGRGDLEHRALPVVDARLLVNLVNPGTPGVLLDPFAGAGGILVEARAAGWRTVSADIDPALRFGLAELADEHHVSDAQALPLPTAVVDGVATEPPYHPATTRSVVASLPEMARVLRPGGRAALLVAAEQADAILEAGQAAGLTPELATPIDRKGTDVVGAVWIR